MVPQKSSTSRPRITSALPISCARAFRLIQGMLRREIHARGQIDDRRLQRFGQLDRVLQSVGRARGALEQNDRVLRGNQHARRFRHRARIALRRHRSRQLRDVEFRVIGNRALLQLAVRNQQHRRHRRRHGDLVGPHGGLREMIQRDRHVVPLGAIAHDGRGILHAVVPFHSGAPRIDFQGVCRRSGKSARDRKTRCKWPSIRAASPTSLWRNTAIGLPSILE